MALTLNSPGVFLQENDKSQVTAGPIVVGAAIVGPTVKGPVEIPTVVTTYSDFQSKFGGAFIDSNGSSQEYLTSIAAYNYFQQGGESLLVTRIVSGGYSAAKSTNIYSLRGYSGNAALAASNRNLNNHLIYSASKYTDGTSGYDSTNGALTASFVLETIGAGVIMNNKGVVGYSGSLATGSVNNVKWEISSVNTGSGQFTLLIRRGDDNDKSKAVLETFANISLDPNTPNYIESVIGNQFQAATLDDQGNYFLKTSGSYPNNSRYVRVSAVNLPTPNYTNSDGYPKNEYTASLPLIGSGTFAGAFEGATGVTSSAVANSMFENIGNYVSGAANWSQGIPNNDGTLGLTYYTKALSLLSNKDQYSYNVVYLPGMTIQNNASVINTLVANTQERGDAIAVVDVAPYGVTSNSTITSLVQSIDSSYAAAYYPWLQVRSAETGKLVFIPPSTLIPAAYEYNDKVGQPWFAPAGISRGSLGTVLQPERRLSVADRDTLYDGKINPIAIFPGQGTIIYGQKTLQASFSALNRVNVRRLLIELKRQIGQISGNLLFEPNTSATRNQFLNQVNPYLAYVQQKQGLYAFQVVMDDSNNTPDVIDRNQLVGAIYLQPTKTSEFIIVDFNITPTGATFGA